MRIGAESEVEIPVFEIILEKAEKLNGKK